MEVGDWEDSCPTEANDQVNKNVDPFPSGNLHPPTQIGPHAKPVQLVPLLPCQELDKTEKKLYIDDLTELEAFNLKSLVPIEPFIGLPYTIEIKAVQTNLL